MTTPFPDNSTLITADTLWLLNKISTIQVHICTQHSYWFYFLYTICRARPKPVIPTPNLKMEGELTRKTSSTNEQYPPRPYCRQVPTPRVASLSVSNENVSLSNTTTYRVDSAKVLGSPLKRAVRHDPHYRRHDTIDWM